MDAIKVIIFDFGGVLINLNRQASVDKLVSLGVHDADSLLTNYVQSGLFLDLESGAISADEFREKLRTDYQLPHLTDAEIDAAFLAFLLDVPEHKLQLLRQLKSAATNAKGESVRIVMLSNTNPIHFPYCIKTHFEYDNHRMSDYFDALYLSYQMHSSKPDNEIFLQLLEQENIAPEQCFFLDDGLANITAAQRLGFRAHLVQPTDNLAEIIRQQGIRF